MTIALHFWEPWVRQQGDKGIHQSLQTAGEFNLPSGQLSATHCQVSLQAEDRPFDVGVVFVVSIEWAYRLPSGILVRIP